MLKLLVDEAELAALDSYLQAEPVLAFMSGPAEVELPLALGRHGIDLLQAHELLRQLALVDLTPGIRARASGYGALGLRALDAIHVATAVELIDALGTAITVVTR